MADTSYSTAKWSTLGVSFLSALLGLALIGVGVYGLLNPLGSALAPTTLSIVTIVVGACVTLNSALGCFGSMTAQRHLLWAYFGILLAFIILMYIVGITALANRGNAITSVLDKRWEYLYDHNPKHIRDLEDRYECCGLMFLDDRAWPKPRAGRPSPKKCSEHTEFGYQRPCVNLIRNEWDERQKQLGVGDIVLASLLLLGLFPIWYQAHRLPTDEEREQQLLDEQRRLLYRVHDQPHGRYGTGDPENVRPGESFQHPVGGPAGSYNYPSGRPGSRSG